MFVDFGISTKNCYKFLPYVGCKNARVCFGANISKFCVTKVAF